MFIEMKTGNAAQRSARMIWSLHVVSLPAYIYFNAKKWKKSKIPTNSRENWYWRPSECVIQCRVSDLGSMDRAQY